MVSRKCPNTNTALTRAHTAPPRKRKRTLTLNPRRLHRPTNKTQQRWNVVVGEWIHAYLYADLQRLGAPRGLALALVFLISGAVHETILAASFGFLMPALFVFFTGPGVALLWLTRWLSPRPANVFLWLALSLGVALLFTMYVDEGVLRSADGEGRHLRGVARLYDAVVPRSLRGAWEVAAAGEL